MKTLRLGHQVGQWTTEIRKERWANMGYVPTFECAIHIDPEFLADPKEVI